MKLNRMRELLCVFLLIFLNACNSVGSSTKTKLYSYGNSKLIIDTNLVNKPGAIIIEPSIRLINKVKKANQDEAGYDAVIDDNVYYMSVAKHYLDSVKCPKIQRESEGSIRFKTSSGKIYIMKLDTIFFGVLLFNGESKPICTSLTDFQEDYKKYMSK
ncbi:hypothetical protein KXQ82_13785 [Mucilaginibacter sp. HMF5004]|uniref:hypothetical protein n=1 Tax=Mucilaginibacter rivuli TaxID=2857527 RepID=UPI001C5EDEEB|nr:hypothetical protein [Mucilaginibacter rivuli]MBW4890797.1 hypothetical protein [Mucilaginibacter rivuli]